MTDHIYGRKNILTDSNRPNMFITELYLYIDYLKEKMSEDFQMGQLEKNKKHYAIFYQNLRNGVSYYRSLSDIFVSGREPFIQALDNVEIKLSYLNYQYSIQSN